MHARLVSYLRDNRDQIIENWLTEVDIPAPIESKGLESGVVPYEFFTKALDAVLDLIENGPDAGKNPEVLHLSKFLGVSCDCRERCFGGRVCLELQDAGLHAFMSVFDDEWDAEHEFSPFDRECSKGLINHALSIFFSKEIKLCQQRTFRNDCPFAAYN
ncbi:hypothetical protein QEH59_03580 [Coraliomargarita sp. SDUM461004]|uniref:Uncharacterized protein n=1 Tax=Thalassobacterium sedimentorum TaxID=3041258 RepID=A0ABU1AFB0_9BACT|nr:hypothetical protein [Coraliomargarita sp. SDUM461004]MDQ8193490.1 hypothetical protein [Coraliomargarita sp. SDUM461004]